MASDQLDVGKALTPFPAMVFCFPNSEIITLLCSSSGSPQFTMSPQCIPALSFTCTYIFSGTFSQHPHGPSSAIATEKQIQHYIVVAKVPITQQRDVFQPSANLSARNRYECAFSGIGLSGCGGESQCSRGQLTVGLRKSQSFVAEF